MGKWNVPLGENSGYATNAFVLPCGEHETCSSIEDLLSWVDEVVRQTDECRITVSRL